MNKPTVLFFIAEPGTSPEACQRLGESLTRRHPNMDAIVVYSDHGDMEAVGVFPEDPPILAHVITERGVGRQP